MGHWVGSDRMLPGLQPTAVGRGARGKRYVEDRPAQHSLHRVDDETSETACGSIDPATLTRMDRPWEKWLALYRCRDCHTAHPDD
jgi:hypothetical protein